MLNKLIVSVVMLLILLLAASQQAFAQTQNSEKSFKVLVGGKNYNLDYNMSNGGAINGISFNRTTIVMTFNVSAPNQAILDLTFPRDLADATSFTDHDPFVFVNGNMADFTGDIPSCSQLTMKIPIPSGGSTVEIIGTYLTSYNYPYPPRINFFKTFQVDNKQYQYRITTDAVNCNTSFNADRRQLHVDITGNSNLTSTGYFRITFPHNLLGGNYTVFVDGKPANYTEEQYFAKSNTDIGGESATQDSFTPILASHITIDYPKDVKSIDIIGTTAAPEFSSAIAGILAASIIIGILLGRQKRLIQ